MADNRLQSKDTEPVLPAFPPKATVDTEPVLPAFHPEATEPIPPETRPTYLLTQS